MNKKVLVGYFVIFGIGALIGMLILIFSGYSQNQPNLGEYRCWNDTKVWSMYNGVKAQQLGISDENIINITYAYLYNYSIWTLNSTPDKFIEIPRQKCCYAIYQENSGGIEEWFCKEDY